MHIVEKAYKIIPVYTADVSGVCSALYELGGMVVMHDPSGCNSTYNTHDETRWYEQDSLIYISGLTEIDAVMGNDRKFIDDIKDAAQRLKPAFIAVCGSPIPFLNGTDFQAIARICEKETGIPSFAVETNGTRTYLYGAGLALRKLGEKLLEIIRKEESSVGDVKTVCESNVCDSVMQSQSSLTEVQSEIPGQAAHAESARNQAKQNSEFMKERGNRIVERKFAYVNVLGLTPLDFAGEGTVDSLKEILQEAGMKVLSTWAMGDTLESLKEAVKLACTCQQGRKAQSERNPNGPDGEITIHDPVVDDSSIRDNSEGNFSCVNLVVSTVGMEIAGWMESEFGIPYVVGAPIGSFAGTVMQALRDAAKSRTSKILCNSSCLDLTDDSPSDNKESFGRSVPARKKDHVCETIKDVEVQREKSSLYKAQAAECENREDRMARKAAVLGEPVVMGSIARDLELREGVSVQVLCPMDGCEELLGEQDSVLQGEYGVEEYLKKQEIDVLVADPLYAPVCPENCRLISLPHLAFSGRCAWEGIPNLFATHIDLQKTKR